MILFGLSAMAYQIPIKYATEAFVVVVITFQSSWS